MTTGKVPPRFELGSLDSESRVLTITPWNLARWACELRGRAASKGLALELAEVRHKALSRDALTGHKGHRGILVSIVDGISACHAEDRGSIPRRGGIEWPFGL